MGAARQDFSHKGPSDNLNLRSSFQEQPGNLSNGFQHSPQKIQAQTNIPDPHLDDTKTSVPLKVPDKNGTSVSDAVDPQNVTSGQEVIRDHDLGMSVLCATKAVHAVSKA
jgi:two-component response regulator (ARR-B family)